MSKLVGPIIVSQENLLSYEYCFEFLSFFYGFLTVSMIQ